MARQDRRSSLDLKLGLLKEGHAFSFFQVIRLLRLFCPAPAELSPKAKMEEREAFEAGKRVKIRPKLSLAFPPADVDRVEELEDEGPHFLVTATFLSLYGTSSPLPTFYTEDLMEEETGDESVTREFIDVLHHRLFLLMFGCWTKYHLFQQIVEERNTQQLERLFCFLGLGERALRREVRDSYSLLRYIGLFTQFPRSAVGLKALLQDALVVYPVQVIPGVRRRSDIPPDQRLFLGTSRSTLGKTSFLGEEIEDRMGKFCIRIGPLPWEEFYELLPGGKNYSKLVFIVKLYIVEPLEYELELVLSEGQVQTTRLGDSEWTRLGWDTWTLSGEERGEVSVTFCPKDL